MSYRIDLTPNASYTETVSVSQDDVGREIAIDLYQDGTAYTIPSGTTITMQGTKPSGLGYTITGTNGTTSVTFLTTAAMTQESGRFASELVLTNGTTVIGTANFWLFCEKNPHPANSTDGTLETIPALEQRIEALEHGGGGLTDGIKQALLQIAQKVAYIDEHGQDYYDALYEAFYPGVTSISAVYTQSGTVYSTTDLNSLKSDLVVTAHYGDGTTARLANTEYTLSGTLATGTSVVTVSYGNKTTTFNVMVTGVVSIDAVYTQSGVVTDTDDLSVLIPDLVVTATLSDDSTFTVPSSDYVLSGTLSDSTSIITVTYGELTDTFEVTVTEIIDYTLNPLANITWHDGYSYNDSGVITATTGEHCTDKFTAQNCIYLITNSDTTNNRYLAVFAWDENGTYLGKYQGQLGIYSLKKNYSYAIKTYNTGTFDSSTITFMPKNNASTASSTFSIKLADFIGNITGSSGRFEFNVASLMSAQGITASNISDKINKCNYLAFLGMASTTEPFEKRDFRFWFYNINTFMFKVSGVSAVADAEAWITANNPEIMFNY